MNPGMLSPSLFTPQAWQDVLDIVAYIADDNASAAEHFVPALEDTCTQLLALPGLGSTRSFQRADLKDVRQMSVTGFENYLIFYVATKQSIKVTRNCSAWRHHRRTESLRLLPEQRGQCNASGSQHRHLHRERDKLRKRSRTHVLTQLFQETSG
jgi:plasmid stabilization system protein ParE